LVLGCTHYPFLRPLIEEMAGTDVAVIDPAPAVARQVGRVLAQQGWLIEAESLSDCGSDSANRPGRQPAHRFYTTGDPFRFQAALRDLISVSTDVRQAAWQRNLALLPVR
jgi:glutamate racemase